MIRKCCGKEYGSKVKFCAVCGRDLEKKGNKINKIVGISICGLIALILISFLISPLFNEPIVGKWDMKVTNGSYSNVAYIEFKDNNTYEINSYGDVVTGKYTVLKRGKDGKIAIVPDDVTQPSYEAEYKIQGDILNIDGLDYKRD